MQEGEFIKELRTNIQCLQRCEWTKEEFMSSDFYDKRLFLRLLVVAKDLASNPTAPINQASGEWKGAKAAYRFFDNKKITHEAILKPHVERTKKRIANHCGTVLVIQDTTFLNYSHMRHSTDLGPIGKHKAHSMGLILHSCLAVTEEGLPLGLLHEDLWARPAQDTGISDKPRDHKPIEDKESYRWLKGIQEVATLGGMKKEIIGVCDREADIYELFVEAQRLGQKILVRAQHDRSLDNGKKLWESFKEVPVADNKTITIPNTKNDIATVEVKVANVTFLFSSHKKNINNSPNKIKNIYAVYLNELNPPTHREAISWMLLTTYKVTSIRKAHRVIKWYQERWKIEVLHKIMKSGCSIELTRLETNQRRFPFIALKTIIAYRLLLITHFNKILPTAPARSVLTQAECDALYSMKFRKITRNQSFDAKKAIGWLAELGGYLSRRSDPLPGPTHIWRGWQRLQDYTAMFALVHQNN